MSAILKLPIQRKRRELGQTSKVYFILCQATFRVKCGVAYDPRSRLAELQTGSPTPLKLIAEIDGDGVKERQIHRRMERWHIHGEWFHYLPEVCEIITDEISRHLKDLYRCDCAVRSDPVSQVVSVGADPRIQRFLSDYTVGSPFSRTQSSILYRAFEDWCRSLGIAACSQKAFTMAMANAGYRRITSSVVFFLDIRLKSEDERKI